MAVPTIVRPPGLLVCLALGLLSPPGRADDPPGAVDAAAAGWVVLSDSLGPDAWRQPTGSWAVVGEAALDPENPRRLVGEPGEGVLINGPTGRTSNLLTAGEFGDVEFHCEFLVPKGSNAGVKFNAVYEVQIFDSYGKETPTASDCGGIYHRAELYPRYHHIDEGFPPLVNACRPPGTWQSLDIIFRAPRFDDRGRKVANARVVSVVLNGELVQDDVELAAPTGNNWTLPERPRGPILLQADHGPVAVRDVRVRPLEGRDTP